MRCDAGAGAVAAEVRAGVRVVLGVGLDVGLAFPAPAAGGKAAAPGVGRGPAESPGSGDAPVNPPGTGAPLAELSAVERSVAPAPPAARWVDAARDSTDGRAVAVATPPTAPPGADPPNGATTTAPSSTTAKDGASHLARRPHAKENALEIWGVVSGRNGRDLEGLLGSGVWAMGLARYRSTRFVRDLHLTPLPEALDGRWVRATPNDGHCETWVGLPRNR